MEEGLRILVIGSGGREHAISRCLHDHGHQVFCHPGNGGTAAFCLPMPEEWKGIDIHDHGTVADFVEAEKVALTIIGPEHPLHNGISDLFLQRKLPLFGPSRKASQLEGSKVKAKEFMSRHHIPTPRYVICNSSHEARIALENCFPIWGAAVVKPDGLTEGKGAMICRSLQEGEAAVAAIMERKIFGDAGNSVIIEELLEGEEYSFFALCDGNSYLPLLPVKDYKRLYDDDKGPNTAGIGACCKAQVSPVIEGLQKRLFEQTLKGFKSEHLDYRGFLYIGVMVTEAGPQVIEYNCRLGDPEAQALLPLLESDLAAAVIAACNGDIGTVKLSWKEAAACCVVMVSRGYPGKSIPGIAIRGLTGAEKYSQITLYHSGTSIEEGKVVTNGGRVIGVTAVAKTLEEATASSYRAVEAISFEGCYYRNDIGRKEPTIAHGPFIVK